MDILKSTATTIGPIIGALQAYRDEAKKKLKNSLDSFRDRTASAIGDQVGEATAVATVAASRSFSSTLNKNFQQSPYYEPVKNYGPYAAGTLLLWWGVDTILNRDKEEVTYRKIRRIVKGAGILGLSAACYGFGVYNALQRKSDSTPQS